MENPGEEIADMHACTQCGQPVPEHETYCSFCGVLQRVPDIEDAVRKQQRLIALAIFFGMQLTVCLISNFTRYARGLKALLFLDGALSLFTLLYIIFFWQELKKLLRWNHFSAAKVAGYALTAAMGAVVVSYSVKWLNKTIFQTDSYYYFAFSHVKYARLVTILVVALQPAIFEELAFRGVIQQGLNKVTGIRQAVFISAFLFALLHMSFISFFWLFPFALWLSYVCIKEETIWYGVVIHFCFNATACFLEFFELNLL